MQDGSLYEDKIGITTPLLQLKEEDPNIQECVQCLCIFVTLNDR